ncbi:hypothetical protein K5X82_00685 [Halosquirtibacter xylanolyticus]|uniref:hypothetical protein n=1 Tax=Halosquirtibacter xylanolyticus TaxID=3374599 RepID=UPI00374A71A6|nr:hypothetical protein K5X82_00685 [Prolixibacteraceae bacterium]
MITSEECDAGNLKLSSNETLSCPIRKKKTQKKEENSTNFCNKKFDQIKFKYDSLLLLLRSNYNSYLPFHLQTRDKYIGSYMSVLENNESFIKDVVERIRQTNNDYCDVCYNINATSVGLGSNSHEFGDAKNLKAQQERRILGDSLYMVLRHFQRKELNNYNRWSRQVVALHDKLIKMKSESLLNASVFMIPSGNNQDFIVQNKKIKFVHKEDKYVIPNIIPNGYLDLLLQKQNLLVQQMQNNYWYYGYLNESENHLATNLYADMCIEACRVNDTIADNIRYFCFYYRTERGKIAREMMLREQKSYAYSNLLKKYNNTIRSLLGDSLNKEFGKRIHLDRKRYNVRLELYSQMQQHIDSCRNNQSVHFEFIKLKVLDFETYSFSLIGVVDTLSYLKQYMEGEFKDKCLYIHNDHDAIQEKSFIYCNILNGTTTCSKVLLDQVKEQYISFRTKIQNLTIEDNANEKIQRLNLTYHQQLYKGLGEKEYEAFMMRLYQNKLYFNYILGIYHTFISIKSDE